MTSRRPATFAVLAAALVVGGGCGSSSDQGGSGGAGSEPAPAETQQPAKAKAQAGAAATAKDTIKDFTFTPKTVTVAASGTVTWANQDSANHNVTFDAKSVEGIGNLRQGETGKVAFSKPGTYPYVCTYHPGMEGTVIVK